MASTNLRRIPESAEKPWASDFNRLLDVILGQIGGRINLTGHDGTATDPYSGATTSSTQHALYVRSAAGLHGRFRKSDDSADIAVFDDAGVTLNGTLSGNGSTIWTSGNDGSGSGMDADLTDGHHAGTGVDNLAFYDASNRVVDSELLAGETWHAAQEAQTSGAYTLTTSMADVPGLSITLSDSGKYLILAQGEWSFVPGGTDGGAFLDAVIVADGSLIAKSSPTYQVGAVVNTGGFAGYFAYGLYAPASSGKVVKLQAQKSAGTAASKLDADSKIVAIWLAP
jgi:hypothetical protein